MGGEREGEGGREVDKEGGREGAKQVNSNP